MSGPAWHGGKRILLDADAIWRSPARTWAEWGLRLDVHRDSITRVARQMGFTRDPAGGFAAAPCKVCERSTPREQLDAHRICVGCRIKSDPAIALYHAERARRHPAEYWAIAPNADRCEIAERGGDRLSVVELLLLHAPRIS